jgi:hypothetical protein
MVLFSLSRRFNKVVGPSLLRYGLSARYAVGKKPTRDSPILDACFLIPVAQKMISLEIQEDANEKLARMARNVDDRSAFGKFADRTFDRIFGNKGSQEHENRRTSLQEIQQQQQQQKKNNVNPRLDAFETYMRHILVPNEKWSDVMRWQFHIRFLNWVRVEFLAARYGLDLREAIEAYPSLRRGPQASLTRVKRKLGFLVVVANQDDDDMDKRQWLPVVPSNSTVVKAFRMQNWSRAKNSNAGWKRVNHLTKQLNGEVIELSGSWLRIAKISPETNVASLSVEDILEVAGAGVSSSGTFNLFCEECNIYQLWTREYVKGLAAHLLDRTRSHNGRTLVLDVGAGDGFLAQLLREAFEVEPHGKRRRLPRTRGRTVTPKIVFERQSVPEVVATDDGSWNIAPLAPVESLGVEDALQKYNKNDESQQLIVLCSWMPMGIDWTAAFRHHKVDEYILIGEYDDGNCGNNWQTWGNIDSRLEHPGASAQDADDLLADGAIVPVYESEGYKRVELDGLSNSHFSRFDSSLSCTSKTFSFRRQNGKPLARGL